MILVKIYRLVILIATLQMLAVNSFAQNKKPITGKFTGIQFTQLVKEIEIQTDYIFYYTDTGLNTLSINLMVENSSLTDLLSKVFLGSVYGFVIDEADHVFVAKKMLIQPLLPKDFFDRSKSNNDSAINKSGFLNENSKSTKDLGISANKVFEIGQKQALNKKQKMIITGFIRDGKSGEPLTGAMVYADTPYVSSITDQFGYYSLSLMQGKYDIGVNSLGMKEARRRIIIYSDGKLDVDLQEAVSSLKNVVVTSGKRSNIKSLQMGADKLSVKTIKRVPAVLGEADVLRVLLTLPGVTSVGESSNGFNVRGGATDQNLILFSDATIYNPSHLFGFFSAFNTDVIKGVDLYKSAIPEKYGGRLSSVLDVSVRDGNAKKITGTGGIGLLTGKVSLEGPIVKDKTSFIVGARTTYSDWLLKQIPNSAYSNSSAGFNDLSLRISHTINPKNNLYLTGYISNDKFRLNNDTLYQYSNKNANLKWKHIFNNKLIGVFIAGWDNYNYSISSTAVKLNAFKLGYTINQGNLKADFNYQPGNKHAIVFGLSNVYYKINPGSFTPNSNESLVKPNTLTAEQAMETSVYFGDQITINQKFTINAGLRYSIYNKLGPGKTYQYLDGLPRDESTVKDSTIYSKNKLMQTWHGPELRLVARYVIGNDASIKVSANSTLQYIHMLSNTVAISPTDVWKLSDNFIKPQRGYQLSMGYYKNFKNNSIETSVEVYYKTMRNYLDFKSGAVLLLNETIERDVINTKGKAYGIEFLIKKNTGKLNGWISYAYSRTFLKQDDELAGQSINKGAYYPANYDKPNSANLIANYQFTHRLGISVNMVYSTGRPITLPIAIYNLNGGQRVYYSDRNQYRVPDYFRTDIAFTMDGNHKVKQWIHNSWSLGVYNLLGRQNPYSIYFIQEAGVIKGYQLSIFGTAIPFISYNFKF